MKIFLDSNVPMYAAGAEHPFKQPSERFLSRVQTGEIYGCTSTEVLQEILHRYLCIGRIELGARVFDTFDKTCREVLSVRRVDMRLARDILRAVQGIAARDAVHAAVMFNNSIEHIVSFDRHFDRIPGITRIEPA